MSGLIECWLTGKSMAIFTPVKNVNSMKHQKLKEISTMVYWVLNMALKFFGLMVKKIEATGAVESVTEARNLIDKISRPD
jgi:hypothetical protein